MNFQLNKIAQSDRVYSLKLDKSVVQAYLEKTKSISVKDIEYIPYFRFLIAREFESMFKIKKIIGGVLNNYGSGALLIDCDSNFTEGCSIKISTAISYLLGVPETDPLSGMHYAIFSIKHSDLQLPNLLRPYEHLKMHTDGAYMKNAPDWLLFMKIQEEAAFGGKTKLLHIDDWEHFSSFYNHEDNGSFTFFASPDSSVAHSRHQLNKSDDIHAPLLYIERSQKSIRFIDRFIHPKSIKEAEYIYEFQSSLERSKNILEIDIKAGDLLLVNNHFWLHGRMAFEKNKNLSRVLMRQRGYFS